MLIVGAGGFAKQLIHAVESQTKSNIFLFDEFTSETQFLNRYPIIHSEDTVQQILENTPNFTLGLGAPKNRKKLSDRMHRLGGKLTTVIASNATISSYTSKIENGVIILGNTLIEPASTIGTGSLINVGTFIAHDTIIGDFCEISPYAKLLGNVKLGAQVFVGAGATVLPGVQIGDGAVIGAGAVVNKNVAQNETVVGVPAHPIRRS